MGIFVKDFNGMIITRGAWGTLFGTLEKIDIKLYPLVTLKIPPSFETLAINEKLRSNKKGVI